MGVAARAGGVPADVGAGQDGGDPPAVRHAAAAGIGLALVVGQNEEPVRADLPQERRHQVAEEAVAGPDRAVVRVVAEVGRDPHERRQAALAEILAQVPEPDDAVAPPTRRADPVVVHERVVLLRV